MGQTMGCAASTAVPPNKLRSTDPDVQQPDAVSNTNCKHDVCSQGTMTDSPTWKPAVSTELEGPAAGDAPPCKDMPAVLLKKEKPGPEGSTRPGPRRALNKLEPLPKIANRYSTPSSPTPPAQTKLNPVTGPSKEPEELNPRIKLSRNLSRVNNEDLGGRPSNRHPPEVFLGGTCGDSRWRIDQAIPLLEAAGCSFYNPQLAPGTWTPKLIPVERNAKKQAECLLFVVTPDTRGVASMVEAAELLSSGRTMVLVMTAYGGKTEDQEMIDDVNRGRKYLRELAARWNCPLLDTVEAATSRTIELVRQKLQIKRTRKRNSCHDLGLRTCSTLDDSFDAGMG